MFYVRNFPLCSWYASSCPSAHATDIALLSHVSMYGHEIITLVAEELGCLLFTIWSHRGHWILFIYYASGDECWSQTLNHIYHIRNWQCCLSWLILTRDFTQRWFLIFPTEPCMIILHSFSDKLASHSNCPDMNPNNYIHNITIRSLGVLISCEP